MAAPQQPTKNPQVDALREQARAALDARKLEEAYDLYQQIIAILPRDNEANEKVGLIAMQRMQGLLKEADGFMRAKKYKEAEEALLELLELDPNNKLAAQKLRSLRKIHGEAKVMKWVKLGVGVVLLIGLVYGGVFAWNNILFSDGKKALEEGDFATAKQKFDSVGTVGVNEKTLDIYKLFTKNMIEIVDLIPKHEYYRSRVLLDECERKIASHRQYLQWNEEWGKQKEKWCNDRLGEGEQAVKTNNFDTCRDIVERILRQDPAHLQAKALGKKNAIAEKIFNGTAAFNDRDLPKARSLAVEALKEVDPKSELGTAAADLKAKAKMAEMREKGAVAAHEGYAVLAVACDTQGKYFCTVGGDGHLIAFDAAKMTPLKNLTVTKGDVFGLAISTKGDYAAITYYKKVDVYSSGGWTLYQSLAGHDKDAGVRCVAFSPRDNFMASGSEGQVRVWRVPSFGEPWMKLSSHTKMVNAVAFSGDEKWLASVSDDNLLKIYRVDPSEIKEERTVEMGDLGPITCGFSPNSKFLVVGTMEGSAFVYTVGEAWDKFKTLKLREKIQSLAFSPDGEYLACGGSQGTIYIYETQKFNPVWTKEKAHVEQINAIAFFSNSINVVTGSRGQIKVWEPEP
jgi:tetratricopeptide (TPR) repeat protein